ncbi:MAG: hypothetical protein IJZ39_03445 [Oscillospiraceae bacterium]|nr:hypothetical protein [Oscillospiraceae bacterium]
MTNFVPELPQYRTVRGWMEDGADLRSLLMAEERMALICLDLARRVSGREASVLQQLAREARGHVACLEGICVLVTGEAPQVRGGAPEAGQTVPLLRRCYGLAMRALVTYEARSDDREYGPVFARLAARQRDQCRTILELTGTLGR